MNRITRHAALAAVALAGAAALAVSPASAQMSNPPMTPSRTTPPAAAADGTTATKTIVEIAQSTGMHNTFVKAVQAAGLAETLGSPGLFTVFAPTDEAFAKLPDGALADLMKPQNKEQLAALLKAHVVDGAVTSQQVMAMDKAKTLEGAEVPITVEGTTVMVGDAKVVKADVVAKNGIVHVIDTVLMP